MHRNVIATAVVGCENVVKAFKQHPICVSPHQPNEVTGRKEERLKNSPTPQLYKLWFAQFFKIPCFYLERLIVYPGVKINIILFG